VQFWELIATDDPKKLVVGIEGAKVPGGIDRVAHAPPAQLQIGNLESFIPLRRRMEHGKPLLRGGLDIVGFQRGLRGWNEDQPVELVLLVGILRRHQMAEMNGIEAPAKESNFHRAERGGALSHRQESSAGERCHDASREPAGG
jgi:hypothetical protein